MGRHYLEPMLSPKAVAVFGASERHDSVGARVFRNLLRSGFKGMVYGINPKYRSVAGLPCHETLKDLAQPVDLAVIATPASTVAKILRDCGNHQVKAAVIISGGFGGRAGAGQALEESLLDEARRGGIRLLGPDCPGIIHPTIGLNATFSNNDATAGSLALISQSGAICAAILDWATTRGVGFSLVVSPGLAIDVDFGDLLDYLALDPATRSVLMYLEGLTDARRFISGLRAAARLKPVVVIKAGRHAEGSRAARSHTGILVGADDVFSAALERAGAVRAETIEQLFAAAELLSSPQRVLGDRLAIITNAGGPGVMATDHAVEKGIRLARLSPETLEALDRSLPEAWSHGNPLDIQGDASPDRYRTALLHCLEDPGVDGALVMLTPQALSQPSETATSVIGVAERHRKPVLVSWLGEQQVAQGRELFAAARTPSFVNPESAIEAFGFLVEHHHNQQLLMQTPGPLAEIDVPDIAAAQMVIEGALAAQRTLLTPLETRAVLGAFHIPTNPAITAQSMDEALAAAECLGFPVAMKIVSPDIPHKSDVDGVRLNVDGPESVRRVYDELMAAVGRANPEARRVGVTVEKMYRDPHGRELFIGVIQDEVFGPVISFGAGGTAIEVLRDRAIALPPLNAHLVRNLIANTRVSRLLGAFRNFPPIHGESLRQVLLRVSEMVCELPQITELDINPLMADDSGVCVLDAWIAVRHRAPRRRRYDHMAIHPYPGNRIRHLQLADGTEVTIRPIRPEDAGIEREFVRRLSPEARYYRFLDTMRDLSPELLIRFTQLDYHRELALIATVRDGPGEIEVGVARFFPDPDGHTAEFALVVADEWQRRGLGTRLMTLLLEAARENGLSRIEGEVLAQNPGMLHFIEKLGFKKSDKPGEPRLWVVSKVL